MSPTTPIKRKSSMGPPSSSSPLTPALATLRTPGTGSSESRGRSQTPFQVKAEPIDPPSPSPCMSRAPSRLPSMSPMSGAIVPYQPRAPSATPSPSRKRSLGMLRDMSPAFSEARFASPSPSIPRARFTSSPSARHRFPSETPSVQRSRLASSARSLSNFSLADSDSGTRIGRAETADYDRRGRNVRPRESREGSSTTAAPAPVPSLPPVPSLVTESAATIVGILDTLWVQDIDAEEESGDKEKLEFKQECLTLVLEHLFDSAGTAERLSKELAEEELIVSARLVNRLMDVLRSGVEDVLTSYLKDFATDGTKSKSKTARQAAWYAKYRAAIPGLAGLLKDLTKSDSTTIISLLSQEWSNSLPALHTRLSLKSVNAKKAHCRSIMEGVRRLSELMIGDIYNEK